MKVLHYKVLSASSAYDLEMEMTHAIKSGWQPIGGIAVSSLNNFRPHAVMQAIVKYEEAKDVNDECDHVFMSFDRLHPVNKNLP